MDSSDNYDADEGSIAIIGMAGRFPGAQNIDEFWQNLKNGKESITFFSDQELIEAGIDPVILKDKNYVKAKGILDNVAEFDAAFFEMSPKEAEITDPQQRLFLECAWEALENAGYDPKNYPGSIGVYGGMGGFNTYLFQNIQSNQALRNTIGDYKIFIGNNNDFACTQVSYKLNLCGPSVSVQTACSTSLVAVVMGYQSLLDYQCDMVLAGGAAISLPQQAGYVYQEGMILSPDGHCRAFDAKAQGTVSGNGVGIVVLKRLRDALADGDAIRAVIRGAAINNDGALKVGYTAPSVDAQSRVIIEALTLADISPKTVSYIETHGTGTPLGDPIEITALTQAFRAQTDKQAYCAIGSVKTNIGHLDAASGVTGLIKAVLSLEHQLIPPSLHFETPNPKLNLNNSPFYVNTQLSEWQTEGYPRRAGVSAFGVGGTNAHVILEEAPNQRSKSEKSQRPWQLLLLSAKTDTALETATTQLAKHLKQHPDINLADVAYTYQVGRHAFQHRRMLVCQTLEDTVNTLETRDAKRVFTQIIKKNAEPSIVFMFSGQGAQYVNMGWELYQTESVFREQVDHCAELLKPHLGLDLRNVLYPSFANQHTPSPSQEGNDGKSPLERGFRGVFETATQQLNQTTLTQPALFVIEYALAQLWKSWGIQPHAMLGHSIGEYVAACLAGVFSLEDALTLVATRGQLIQSRPVGAMLAVPLPEEEIKPLINQYLDLAAINVPSQTVVSGTFEAVEQLATQLAEQGVECQRLHTSHAFHSEMMDPILPSFLEQVQKITCQSPQIPFISNVTGTWISGTEATDPHYWVKHLRQTVRFAEGLQQLFQELQPILLEVGPGRTLSTFAKRHPDKTERLVLTSLPHPKDEQSDSAFILNSLGQLWMAGITVNWSEFYAEEQRSRLPLPTYPFERQRYWIEPQKQVSEDRQSQQKLIVFQRWKTLIEATQRQAQQGVAEFDNPTYQEKYQWLNRLSAAYVNFAFQELGAFSNQAHRYSSDELRHRFHILPFYRQMVPRCLDALVKEGQLQQQNKEFTNFIPMSRDSFNTVLEEVRIRWANTPELPELVQLCGEKLAAILTGQENPRELLFTGTAFDTLQNFYKNSPESRYFGMLGQASIKRIVKSLPSETQLRILEIGAGTGATTAYLLPELPQHRTHYVFTDIGSSFLNQAPLKFSAYPYLEYRLLDIEENPTEQGYESYSFDIIIAAQVLHATKNLGQTLEHIRSLLAPGGYLLLWETTQPTVLYFDVYLPIMQPFEEKDELRSDYPFLTIEQWDEALRQYGFVEVKAFPKTDALDDHFLIAQASSTPTLPQTAAAFTEKFQIKTVQPLKKKPNIADWFYLPIWKHSTLSTNSEDKLSSQHRWLVFVDDYGLGSKIVQRLKQDKNKLVISVKMGSAFLPDNNQIYILNPRQSEDYDTLFKALYHLDQVPTTIVHLWNITAQNDTEAKLEQLEHYQTLGFYSLLFLVQALGKQNITEAIQIHVVSNNLQQVTGNDILCPEKATLLGPCKVIPQEYPNINCRSIDVVLPESKISLEGTLVEQLLAELTTTKRSDSMIAYRDTNRWIQTFKPVQLDYITKETRLREKGVYLITGGLGGIGLVLAEHLAKTIHARLVLITHSFFPDNSAWDEWLNTHDERNSVSHKIRKVQAIEAMGSKVLIVNADVTNLGQMLVTITQILEEFDHIHGVIHAAGVFPSGSIQLKTPEMAERILAPKVRGALVLDAVLKEQPLDFMVLCSSIASIVGGVGMVEHCSANAFLDSFAHHNTSQNDKLTISINWDIWQKVGQAAEAANQEQRTTKNIFCQRQSGDISKSVTNDILREIPTSGINVLQENLQQGLLPTEGIEIFNRILCQTQSQVVVSTLDLQARLEQDSILPLSKESVLVNLPKSTHLRPQLKNNYVAPRNKLERKFINVWEKFLGIEGLGIHDDFFELGGDSLMAVQLVSELRKTMQMKLSAHSLLEKSTVADLVESVKTTATDYTQINSPLPASLVKIQAGNSLKQPLFLVHPAGGHVYIYRDLARYLGSEQPVYGLQAQGKSIGEDTLQLIQISDMATHYIKALRVIQPDGPYLLGGSSFGGMVAFEMAQQIRTMGLKVALLVFIDTPSPGYVPELFKNDSDILAYLLIVGDNNSSVSLEQLRQLNPDERLKYFLEHGKITNRLLPSVQLEELRYFMQMFDANCQVARKYKPQPYNGRIVFFRASEGDAFNQPNPERGWFDLAIGGVEVHEIPGNHITMNYPPHVEVMAKQLKSYLDEI